MQNSIKEIDNAFELLSNAHHHDINQTKINELSSQNVKIQNQVSNWKMIALIAIIGIGLSIIYFQASNNPDKDK